MALCKLYPFWGYRRMAVVARRDLDPLGYSDRLVYRIMREQGLLQPRPQHDAAMKKATRLFDMLPKGPNELWQMDVTYILLPSRTWWYVVTVMDYYSRYLLACHVCSRQTAQNVVAGLNEAVAEAERLHGPLQHAPRLVTDNGSAFMSKVFKMRLGDSFQHVRTQYRTPEQLGLLERFHKTFKYEEVYQQDYASPAHCRECIEAYRRLYNEKRPHWALRPAPDVDPITPMDVYVHGVAVELPKWQGWARAKEKMDKEMEANPDFHAPQDGEISV